MYQVAHSIMLKSFFGALKRFCLGLLAPDPGGLVCVILVFESFSLLLLLALAFGVFLFSSLFFVQSTGTCSLSGWLPARCIAVTGVREARCMLSFLFVPRTVTGQCFVLGKGTNVSCQFWSESALFFCEDSGMRGSAVRKFTSKSLFLYSSFFISLIFSFSGMEF